jgi:radial spoke head protein 9
MAFYTVSNQENLDLLGFTLNIEEKACLGNSMIIKKNEENFDNIHLWGKLLGIQQDYFIAQAFNEDYFKRKYFYTYVILM